MLHCISLGLTFHVKKWQSRSCDTVSDTAVTYKKAVIKENCGKDMGLIGDVLKPISCDRNDSHTNRIELLTPDRH